MQEDRWVQIAAVIETLWPFFVIALALCVLVAAFLAYEYGGAWRYTFIFVTGVFVGVVTPGGRR